MKMTSGWKSEKERHKLSRNGVKTKQKSINYNSISGSWVSTGNLELGFVVSTIYKKYTGKVGWNELDNAWEYEVNDGTVTKIGEIEGYFGKEVAMDRVEKIINDKIAEDKKSIGR